jgi:hypothetical protein
MITKWRREFNQQYTEAAYIALLEYLEKQSGTAIQFRIAETPCFLPKTLLEDLSAIGTDLTNQLLDSPEYLASSLSVIPEAYRMQGESSHPHFMTADFGFVRTPDGDLAPKLVELQAFPSVFALQVLFGEAYRKCYHLAPELDFFLGGHDAESFWKLFRQVVVGEHDPSEVVLVEIHPEQQKTLPDFLLTSRHLGIATVDVTQLVVEREGGRTRLYYRPGDAPKSGGLQRIARMYNRVIVDELIQKSIELPFDYREDLDVEWAGHPNWYFRISKYSIPFLKHESVPEAVFLDDWLAGAGSNRLHQDRKDILLKPLFSFAGKGILFAPTDEEIAAIPPAAGHEYLVQERVDFAPVIETPFGPTQAEIRILYLWPDEGTMQPVLSLARLGRGKMMGVDHNRDQKWVGASTTYFPK